MMVEKSQAGRLAGTYTRSNVWRQRCMLHDGVVAPDRLTKGDEEVAMARRRAR
jgi:hypothetical protein